MTAERREGRCILVGVQINGNGREILGWAINKIAGEGDRIVAVHVCRSRDPGKDQPPCLIKVLDDCLAEHDDICRKKKVGLAGRISPGKSIKKALVKEAELHTAGIVVVGSDKNCSIGSTSMAKYCAKKLSPTTAIIAVHKGKIIFQRPETKFLSSGGGKENSAVSAPVRKSPETIPGWPLLRQNVMANIEALKANEARKMSVVQWVMKLPNRTLPITQKQVDLVKEIEKALGVDSSSCKLFQYEELEKSTNHFSSENLIGRGGNSKVYKGCILSGQQVAIKVSKLSAESSRDFIIEIDIVTKLQHERVVPMIGYCIEDNVIISVYPYFSRGSLQENLQGERGENSLAWEMRFKVAVGVAEALSYLHNGCLRPVIHRDIKSSNILLSEESGPQISDFGLAMWAPTTSSNQTHSDVVGTFGYLAPEYFMYGKVSSKIDVYAFGIVLLELLTGRKPINEVSPKGQESLVMWAKPILERGDIMELLDPNLDRKYEEAQLRRMILAASLSIRRSARHRPEMTQVS
ncbi:Proline-rich receptor-like protein kinase PERK12 [Apostasia shenzhenica]|uniref:Proline-rich receptor-like protein kinase PERK12 n=1 Tax=Apostasia shenzhenica TaxID=1088818 RepID=A0A2I0AX65_9ASPA|nr:Proline-rich receptor-like protein kinase PERK12 [Apostasia shenzhenica]